MRSKRSNCDASGNGPGDLTDFADEELLSLAAQLSSEANRLATVYPPKSAVIAECQLDLPTRQRDARAGRHIPGWIGTGVAVLLTISLGTLWVFWSGDARDDTSLRQWRTAQPHAQGSALTDQGDELPGDELLPGDGPVISPVMFVSELSDPELEAWLDLHHHDVEERIAF